MKYSELSSKEFLDYIQDNYSYLDIRLISDALKFAISAHRDQFRSSGEEYIQHPLQVSHILLSLNMDTPTIVAGLLHDVVEDTEYKANDLVKKFGEEITNLVIAVTKLERYKYRANRTTRQAENFRHLLFSITKDIRVIIIKLADRLHNMRTLDFLSKEKQLKIAQETIDIYAPLANRFGMAKIQWELEDLSFKYLYPDEYRNLIQLIDHKKHERDQIIESVVSEFQLFISKEHIKGEVKGRNKHFYSIFKKNMLKKVKFTDILDLYGIRIIVESVEDCYKLLGLIQTQYQIVPKSLKDYINRPKSNNYRSIHIVVINNNNYRIEIQIRTREMHFIAEEGIAAHWRYKENPDKISINNDLLIENYQKQISWIRRFLKHQENGNPVDFIDILKLNLYQDTIVVCTPDRDYIKLPKHSTPIDLAFKIHSEIGYHCSGAIVNGKHATIRQELFSGDVVKILTNPQAKPSKDWLNFVKSSRVKHKIRSYFRKVELQKQIETGKELFFKRSRKMHIKIKTDQEINQLARKMNIFDNQTFFAQLGANIITFEDIIKVIDPLTNTQIVESEIKPSEEIELEIKRSHVDGIIIEDIDQLMIRYAKCCNPVPGDSIIGYTTRGRGITIHKESCKNPGFLNLSKKEPERIIKAYWKYKEDRDKQS